MRARLYISRIDPGLGVTEDFSQYRLERLRGINNPSRRAESVTAERLLLCALRDMEPGTALPPEIRLGAHGKPELLGSALHFSLSHSGDYCVCALCEAEIGVDIQRRVPLDRRVAERKFSAAERDFVLSASEPDAAFTRIWAMKESYVKALGAGLSLPLESFCVLSCGAGFCTGEHDGHFYALCVPQARELSAECMMVDRI